VGTIVKEALTETVTRVLTPKRNIDILRGVEQVAGEERDGERRGERRVVVVRERGRREVVGERGVARMGGAGGAFDFLCLDLRAWILGSLLKWID
tara:strand:+ start:175 stop:459 length:285 start_codon:yes stop_codon:yes gene_type:complete